MRRSEFQKSILKSFMYKTKLRYNEIWDKTIPSNKFDYHLKQLIKEGIIEKQDTLYQLTSKGLYIISSLDGVVIEEKKQPLVCSFILGYDKKKNKVLMQIRTKQPFYGVFGIPGGKLEFGSSTVDQAAEEFKEETGFSGKLKLKLITNYITYNLDDKQMAHHMIGFMYLATDLQGELIEETREGKNIFISPDEISNYDIYPDIPFNVETLLSENDSLVYKEGYREISNGKFISFKFLNEK